MFDHSVAGEKFAVGILSNMVLIRSLKLCIFCSIVENVMTNLSALGLVSKSHAFQMGRLGRVLMLVSLLFIVYL